MNSVQEEVEELFVRKLRRGETVVENVGGIGVSVEFFENALETLNPERLTVLFEQMKFGRGAEVVLAEIFSVEKAVHTEREITPLEGLGRVSLEHLRRRPGSKDAVHFSEKRRRGVNNVVAHVLCGVLRRVQMDAISRGRVVELVEAREVDEAEAAKLTRQGPTSRRSLFRVRARRTRPLL